MDQKRFQRRLGWALWAPFTGSLILAATLIVAVHLFLAHAGHGGALANNAITVFLILLATPLALLARNRLTTFSQSLIQELNTADRNASEAYSQKCWLQTTLTSIGDAVIATDADGLITLMNPVAEQMTGWTLNEGRGKPLTDIFRILNEQTREPVENPVDKVRRLNRVVGLANHTILINKQGQELAIDDSGAPIFGPDGRLSGIILIFRDVTEQRRYQKAAAQLAAIVEHSGDAIATKNLAGIIQTWNAGAERLFGYRADEIIGKSVTVLFPPERLGEEDEIIHHLREGLPSERLETIRVAKDGRRIPVSVNVSPIKDADGYIIGASKVIHDVTELAARREALIQERELLARTLTSIGDAVIVTDAEGRITLVNAEAEHLTGWNISDAAGRPLQEVFRIVNEHTRQPAESPVEKVLRLGIVVGLANHTLLLAKDGREIPIDDSAAPIRQSDGALFGVVLVFRDFTERRAIEERLRESVSAAAVELQSTKRLLEVETQCAGLDGTFDECLTAILEAAIALTNADKGNIQLCDESGALRIVAQRGFDEPFLRFFARVTSSDRSACAEAPQTRERTIVDDVRKNDLYANEPTLKVMLEAGVHAVQSTPLKSGSGKILGVISTHFCQPHRPSEREFQLMDLLALQAADYLQRKQAETALRERSEELVAMVERMPALVWIAHDPQCRKVTGNTAASKLLDVSQAHNVSQTPANGKDLLIRHFDSSGRELQPDELPIQRAAATGVPVENLELQMLLPDGRRVWIAGSATPLFDAHGKVRGVISAFLDITGQKQLEGALRANERLALAGRLSASIAHEIHNPLDVVLNALFLLSENLDGKPEARQFVELAEREVRRVTEISRNMLSLHRESRAPSMVNLSELIETAVALIRQTIGKSSEDIELQLDFCGNVEAFPADLRQVFTNLIKNAIEAAGPRGRIKVISQKTEQNGRKGALVHVIDNGIGISDEVRSKLFTPFVTDKEQGGTGLGLWVSRNIVERHGGTINIASNLDIADSGTTVSVFLPLKLRE